MSNHTEMYRAKVLFSGEYGCPKIGTFVFGSLVERGERRFIINDDCELYENIEIGDNWHSDSITGFIDPIEVDPKTVGKNSGVQDKNGKYVYSRDIILRPNGTVKAVNTKDLDLDDSYSVYKKNPPETYIIYNKGYAFTIGTPTDDNYCGVLNNARHNMSYEIEIIGNIDDNPELCGQK